MTDARGRCCHICEHYRPFAGDAVAAGKCHRFPPVPVVHRSEAEPNHLEWHSPTVVDGHLCGEWKKGERYD